MKKMFRALTLAAATLSAGQALAEINVRVSEDTLGLGITNIRMGESSSADLEYRHDSDFDLLTATGWVEGEIGDFIPRLGLKVLYLDGDYRSWDYDGYGLAMGGDLTLPLNERFSLTAKLFLASDKMTGSDLEGWEEWGIGFRANVVKNGSLYLGYGSLEVDSKYKDGIELDKGFNVGMALKF